MGDSRLLFWDVDTQHDFMEPKGKLYVPGAEQIVDHVRSLNQWAASHDVLVISSVDAHQPGDPELTEYPPHCMAGTPGQRKQPGTLLDPRCILPSHEVALPDLAQCRQVIVEKQALDVFTNPNLDGLLKAIGDKLHVVLYGLVTELCVDRAIRGLMARGHKVDIVVDAVRHLKADLAEETFSEIKRGGGKLLKTDDILSRSSLEAA